MAQPDRFPLFTKPRIAVNYCGRHFAPAGEPREVVDYQVPSKSTDNLLGDYLHTFPPEQSMSTERRIIISTLTIALTFLILPHRIYAQYPAILIPNYNRIPIGEIGALEGGAYIARVADASAGWYNPAGLANIERDTFSGSVNLYERITTQVPGEEKQTKKCLCL